MRILKVDSEVLKEVKKVEIKDVEFLIDEKEDLTYIKVKPFVINGLYSLRDINDFCEDNKNLLEQAEIYQACTIEQVVRIDNMLYAVIYHS